MLVKWDNAICCYTVLGMYQRNLKQQRLSQSLVREQTQFYKLQGNKFTFKLFKKLSHFKWLVFSTNIKHFSTCQNGQTIKICHSVSSEAAELKKYLVYVLLLLHFTQLIRYTHLLNCCIILNHHTYSSSYTQKWVFIMLSHEWMKYF